MTGDLELSVLQRPSDGLGYIAGFAVTEELVIAAGGTSSHAPTLVATSNVRHFEVRKTPRHLGLRDVLVVGDALWVCGEYGQLGVSRDRGATWKLFDTSTDACLFALAHDSDGAVWVVGDNGYAARVVGDKLERVDLRTTARLAAIYPLREELVVLGFDGVMYRWRRGEVMRVATGATKPLTALCMTKVGTWLLTGDGGFIARSPDGTWWSRVKSGVEVDLESIASCADGRVVAVGDRGLILVSTDDGRRWETLETSLVAHLWSVERFGDGVLIGGDDGLIAKLAPKGDQTWSDRINVFGGGKPLDAVFAPGPEGFIGSRLAKYLAGIDGAGTDKLVHDAASVAEFERLYGVAMPAEAQALFAAMEGRDPSTSFTELRLENAVAPTEGGKNLFELLVRRDQDAYLDTALVEAFCGVFGIGSQGNGDTYHMEVYEWDGPRQVLHYDHETHAFTGVFADSLDSLVYLAALERAHGVQRISDEAFTIGLRKLRGKVAPSWHFAIEDDDPGFVALDPKRRDTEFFFYRSRWICALLKNDGVTDIADIPRLFNADFNQVVPQDQLAARYEACERFIPTALYSVWRAFLFDEPELAPYLEIGRRHSARLVRDAAALIDELRAGRNELGTIKDVRAHLAAFRALDLDPRRADQRKAEADARAKADASRAQDAAGELARAPRSMWRELAWRWLDDGVAHRALLQRLDGEPDAAAQIAALDELRRVSDSERELMLQRLAGELSPELEAVLVGSLVRGDAPDDVLVPAEPSAGELAPDEDGEGDDGEDEDEDASPGWDAIDAALQPIYGDGEPHAHYGTVVPYMLGGNDPLHGISVYLRDEPVPHFHFVTYGFTDLFTKETEDPAVSGFGFELTLRLRRAEDDDEVPAWPLNFLQNLARYVFGTGNRFGAGHKMGLNGPIAQGQDTRLTAVLFADDPELGEFSSEHGHARFLQVVGITDDEYRLIQEWSTSGLVEILREQLPVLVTDLARDSVLVKSEVAARVRARVEREGSSEELSFAGEMQIDEDDEHLRIEMGALYAAALPRAMRGRLRHGRGYTLRGRVNTLVLTPGDANARERRDDQLELTLSPDIVREIEARLGAGFAGEYRFETWPGLVIAVTPSFIRDPEGRVVDVRGIRDAAQARQLVAEENARLAAEEDAAADEELGGDADLDEDDRESLRADEDHEEDEDDGDDEDDEADEADEDDPLVADDEDDALVAGDIAADDDIVTTAVAAQDEADEDADNDNDDDEDDDADDDADDDDHNDANGEADDDADDEDEDDEDEDDDDEDDDDDKGDDFAAAAHDIAADDDVVAARARADEHDDEESDDDEDEADDDEDEESDDDDEDGDDDDEDDKDDKDDEDDELAAADHDIAADDDVVAARARADEHDDEGGGEDDEDDDGEYGDEHDDEDDEDADDERAGVGDGDGELPTLPQIRAALAMTSRALRLAPGDADAQFTHAMLLLDADRAGVGGMVDELLRALPRYAVTNRLHIALRMGKQAHPRFSDALDSALGDECFPDRILAGGGTDNVASYGDVTEDLFNELGELVLARSPEHVARLAPLLPARVNLLANLAWQAIQAEHTDEAIALYQRLLELPIPDDADERTNYLRAMNNACVQAHTAKVYAVAARIADRAQPVAHENPYIYHSAACAYAAVGDYVKAFEQVKLAMKHGYDHLGKVEVDSDLGQLLEWPEFKALFREWHARQEGN